MSFLIFSYHVNRPSTNSKVSTVNDFLTKESTINDEFSLSIKMSNVSSEQAQKVHDFLIKRLCKGTVYAGTGQTSKIGSHIFYYCLVRNENSPETTSQKEFYFSQEYVICFLAKFYGEEDEGFELFRQELDVYSRKVSQLLFAREKDIGSVAEDDGLKSLLENWYSTNIEFVKRCVDFFSDCLESILFYALQGRKIQLQPNSEDIIKFLKVTSVYDLLPSDSENGSILRDKITMLHEDSPEKVTFFDNQTVKLTLGNGKAKLDQNETNDFCKEWAEKMINIWKEANEGRLKNEDLDPSSIILRRILENYKLKAIQEVNTIKRLVRRAESDYYAMYTCYQQLKRHSNRDVILGILLKDATLLNNDDEAYQVLSVLNKMIAED